MAACWCLCLWHCPEEELSVEHTLVSFPQNTLGWAHLAVGNSHYYPRAVIRQLPTVTHEQWLDSPTLALGRSVAESSICLDVVLCSRHFQEWCGERLHTQGYSQSVRVPVPMQALLRESVAHTSSCLEIIFHVKVPNGRNHGCYSFLSHILPYTSAVRCLPCDSWNWSSAQSAFKYLIFHWKPVLEEQF